MRYRLILSLFVLGWVPLSAANYADRDLDQFAAWVETSNPENDPVMAFLKAEMIYMLGHESGQQERIADLLAALFKRVRHGESKAAIGYYYIQQCRHLGRLDDIADAVRELGFLEEADIIGPLAPRSDFDLKSLIGRASHAGLDRTVQWHKQRSYGTSDYWSEGIGNYGYFAASQAIYPNQSAGVMVTTWFRAPKKGTVRLGLGWSQKMRAWINQTEVFQGDDEQKAFPDQSVVTVRLKKGWHRLTIYSETQGDNLNLGFYARLTDSDGRPLEVKADRRDKVPSRKVADADNPEPRLLELASKKSEAELGCTLLIRQTIHHPEYGDAKVVLAKAFHRNYMKVVAEKLLTLAEDANEKWEILNEFLANTPKGSNQTHRAWAQTQLGQVALEQGRYWEARHLAEKALEEDAGYWPAQLLQNNTFATLGLDGQALRDTTELAQKYPNTPWIMMDLCDLYWAMHYRGEGEPYLNKILKVRHASTKYAERKAELLKSRGDLEALEALFQQSVRESPYAIVNLLAYAEFLANNRQFEKAEGLLGKYLKQFPENPFLLETMGEVRLRRGAGDALSYLEQALALRPQNPELENLIALTKSEQERFYQPYAIEKAPDVAVLEVSPLVINFENQVRKVSPNGQSSNFFQIEYEILEDQANQELPGFSFSYAPLRQKAKILKAEIKRGDQTILLTKHGRTRISDPAYRMYYDLVAYQIAFPTLEPGDRIYLEYRIDDTDSRNIFGDYFGDFLYFSKRYPAKRLAYTLILPKGRAVYHHVEKMEPEFKDRIEGENRVMTWQLDQVSPYETEARMPGLTGYLPYVSISSFKDWQDMATWYSKLIEEQLKLDHDTKTLVHELIDGLTDPLEIVKAIHEYVVTHTRYVALEFGVHGYKPYQVNQVCSRQFGDCKDKASLLVAMLREAGVEASIVIVRTSDEGEVNPYPASLNYFNHAIAYVPKFDLFLDGTAEFSGIRELPEQDQGALVLIVDKDGKGNLTKIPIYDENRENYSLSVAVRPDGEAEVEGALSFAGIVNPELRQYLSIESQLPSDLQNLMVEMLPGLDVQKADRQGRRINEPITLTFQGVSSQLLEQSGTQWKLPLHILNSRLVQQFAPNARRKFPLTFGPPQIKEVKLDIAAPEGYKFTRVPDTLDLENDNISVRISFENPTEGRCKVNYRLAFKTPQVNPDDYSQLRDLMQAHDRVLDQAIFVGNQ